MCLSSTAQSTRQAAVVYAQHGVCCCPDVHLAALLTQAGDGTGSGPGLNTGNSNKRKPDDDAPYISPPMCACGAGPCHINRDISGRMYFACPDDVSASLPVSLRSMPCPLDCCCAYMLCLGCLLECLLSCLLGRALYVCAWVVRPPLVWAVVNSSGNNAAAAAG